MQLHVTAEITAVKFWPLNSFEWATLRILSAFPDNPPNTLEATERLSLHEPAFIRTALEQMSRAGALVLRDESNGVFDLENFSLTEEGAKILRAQGWEEEQEENSTKEFVLEWPTVKIIKNSSNLGGSEKLSRKGPTPDEVQERLSSRTETLENWLNSQNSSQWKIRSFFITDVQG